MAKTFRVDITKSAEADIDGAHAYIAQRDVLAADRWVARVEAAIRRLSRFPRAHEVIPEAEELGQEYRHKLLGKYRTFIGLQPIASSSCGSFTPPACLNCGCWSSLRLGNGAAGHDFPDELTAAEKRAVMEYLKTL